MKKVLMTALAAAFAVSAASAQSLKFQTFADSIGIKQKNVPTYSVVEVAFPVDGPAALVKSLKTTLSERYQIPVAEIKDGKTFANKLANKNVANMKRMFVEDFDQDDNIPELYTNNQVSKSYENDKLVTLMFSGDVYYGGAHNSVYSTGVTFRKSDGKAFGADIFNEDAWEQIQDKVAASLREYFEVDSNDEMAEILFEDGIICDGDNFFVPTPDNPPFVDNGELVMIYQSYEIAPFAAGMPEVRIPLKELMPYLGAEFAALVK